MAELTTTDSTPVSSCCSAEAQVSCCEPSDKAVCCGTSAAGGSCGCSAGQGTGEPALDIRETVRVRYAEVARAIATEASVEASPGCGVPTAVAELHEGETVLDLARANAAEAG